MQKGRKRTMKHQGTKKPKKGAHIQMRNREDKGKAIHMHRRKGALAVRSTGGILVTIKSSGNKKGNNYQNVGDGTWSKSVHLIECHRRGLMNTEG